MGIGSLINTSMLTPFVIEQKSPKGLILRECSCKFLDRLLPFNEVKSDDFVCLKLRGLPFTASVEDITIFFAGYNVIQDSVKFAQFEDGRKTG